jgi:hypothetical protein
MLIKEAAVTYLNIFGLLGVRPNPPFFHVAKFDITAQGAAKASQASVSNVPSNPED